MNALNNLLLPFEMEGDTAEEEKDPAFLYSDCPHLAITFKKR